MNYRMRRVRAFVPTFVYSFIRSFVVCAHDADDSVTSVLSTELKSKMICSLPLLCWIKREEIKSDNRPPPALNALTVLNALIFYT